MREERRQLQDRRRRRKTQVRGYRSGVWRQHEARAGKETECEDRNQRGA
jgi:hypothetical protein